ncbi:MAG TPA: putative metal-dependent hydrolase [Gemmatimonadales bacterium]|nr:putative metal-dependent hydrolase [Gemmatimonadales bacterium]
MTDLRYPIGTFEPPVRSEPYERQARIAQIAQAPAALRRVVSGLSDAQLDTPYRPGGWTVRQVAHHLPDSHLNAYMRMRLALTEDEPAIKSYAEERWAELPDARGAPVELSLALLDALHARWMLLLGALEPVHFARAYRHPEMGRVPLDMAIALYAWHGRHHVAHISTLRERMGW